MILFPGIPEPAWAWRFDRSFISIARLRRRKADFRPSVVEWAMDSAAFSEVALKGGYEKPGWAFALEAAGWCKRVPGCRFVASQDFMCEPFVLEKTGLTIPDHQRMTIERLDEINGVWRDLFGDDLMAPQLLPVLQGFKPREYLEHLEQYGERLTPGMWVGVGSVCKRQGDIALVEDLLQAIHEARPDLRLHGFGVKITALRSPLIRQLLFSADSMAWAYAARKQGRNPNDWKEAAAFVERVAQPVAPKAQMNLFGWHA